MKITKSTVTNSLLVPLSQIVFYKIMLPQPIVM